MDTKKTLSVIIPTYNVERYLHKCLSSLIVSDEKLFNCLEVIVIIDGATDNSSQIAHSYENDYPEVFKVIDKQNGNYGSCINRGIKEANGKYIKILDADDSLETSVLSQYITFLNNCNTDVVISGYRTVDESGKTIQSYKRSFQEDTTLYWEDIYPSLTGHDHFAMIEAAYRSEIIQNIGYTQTEGISYTDQEWIFYPMQHMNTFCYIDIILYNYLIGREGQTVQHINYIKGFDAHRIIALRMIDHLATLTDCDTLPIRYLRINALWVLKVTYLFGLTQNISSADIERLKALDKHLLEVAPDLYLQLDKATTTIKKLQYHHIRNWRRSHGRFSRPLIIELLYKIYKRIK